MTITELQEASGMNTTELAKYFGIPYRTLQNWKLSSSNARTAPQYLLELMEYKLRHEDKIK